MTQPLVVRDAEGELTFAFALRPFRVAEFGNALISLGVKVCGPDQRLVFIVDAIKMPQIQGRWSVFGSLQIGYMVAIGRKLELARQGWPQAGLGKKNFWCEDVFNKTVGWRLAHGVSCWLIGSRGRAATLRLWRRRLGLGSQRQHRRAVGEHCPQYGCHQRVLAVPQATS